MITLDKKPLTENDLKNLVADILKECQSQGATQAEVDISVNKGFSVQVRQGDVETIEYNRDKGVGITVYFGHRVGTASISDLRPEAIRSAVKAACNIARFADQDPCAELAEEQLMAKHYPEIPLKFPWDLTVDQAIALGKNCEAIALEKDKRIFQSEGVTVATIDGLHAYGNSHGFIGSSEATRHDISCALIGKQNNEMENGHYYTVHCDAAELLPITEVAQRAVERTVHRLGARRLKTQKVPVIFHAEEARGLIGSFLSAIAGSSIYRKSSFLVDQLGKSVFASFITLDERPHLPKALGSAPFDNDGVLTRPNVFVKEGVLQNYALSAYSARKLNMQTTANAGGVHNLFISTSNKNFAELLKTMDRGLLVTELMGHGTNIVTGDYSQGASGFWVEDGVIQYPVKEITIAGNLRDMFLNIVAVGNDVDTRGNVQTGSILLAEMTIAGE